MYKGFDLKKEVRVSMRKIYINILKYRLEYYNETIFIDQYMQSDYVQLNLAKQLADFEIQHKPLYELLKKGQKEGLLVSLPYFTIINFINGSIRSASNGMVQKLIPNTKQGAESGFETMWKGISL